MNENQKILSSFGSTVSSENSNQRLLFVYICKSFQNVNTPEVSLDDRGATIIRGITFAIVHLPRTRSCKCLPHTLKLPNYCQINFHEWRKMFPLFELQLVPIYFVIYLNQIKFCAVLILQISMYFFYFSHGFNFADDFSLPVHVWI